MMADIGNLSDLDTTLIKDTFSIAEITDFQCSVLEAVLEGRDVFVCKRTGSGKSLCFQALPILWSVRQQNKAVLIVSPLISIMEEQCSFLSEKGFDARILKDGAADDLAGCVFLFSSPEVLLSTKSGREKIINNREMFGAIVVDEVHTVLQWGEKQHGSEEAFREWFGHLGELRSLLPTVLVLALTATATAATRHRLKGKLAMINSADFIDSPDRPNIKLSVKRVGTENSSVHFAWLSDNLFANGETLARHLIFCSSTKEVLRVHGDFITTLPSSYWKYVAMYHSSVLEATKSDIHKDFTSKNGQIRILICTDAAGMGVNFPDVRDVIHYGPPYNMSSFVQQLGRAGRDGSQSQHLLMFSGRQMRKVEAEMKSYVYNNEICRRDKLCSVYGARSEQTILHLCCDICEKICSCMGENQPGCSELVHPAFSCETEELPDTVSRRYRFVAIEHEEDLKHRLAVYCQCLQGETKGNPLVGNLPMHGLDSQVIAQIVVHCGKIFTADDVMKLCNVTNFQYATDICSMILDLFDFDYRSDEHEWSDDDNLSDIG